MSVTGFSRLLTRLCAAALITCFASTTAHALDDKRAGFIIAFGGGGQITSLDFDFDETTDQQGEFVTGEGYGLALQLSIGGAFSDQFAITGTHQVSRYRVDSEEHTNYLLGVTGTYWFRPVRPSLYLSATFGRLSVQTDAYDNSFFNFGDSATGYAGRFAVGYEFASRLHLEGGLTIGKSDNGFDRDGPRLESTSAQVIASFVWY
jgi:hypothetical protein